jgi:molybdopterin adenylyltransferase
MGDKSIDITVAVLTLSDKGSKGERKDDSGLLIQEMLKDIKAEIKYYDILPDEKQRIKEKLIEYSSRVDLILTTGGTGLSPRDVTPEATLEILDRQVPGIAEAMRSEGLNITKRAMLSRSVAGVRGRSLIVNLPGSPKAVKESLSIIIDVIPHAIQKIKGDISECAR